MPIPWNQDDLAAALAGREALSDADAAASLNAETADQHVDLATTACRDLMYATGAWGKVRLRSTRPWGNDAEDALTELCILVVDSLTLQQMVHTASDATWPQTVGMLAALVGAGLITQDTADAFSALRTMQTAAWGPPVSDVDVAKARGTWVPLPEETP